MTTTPTPTLAPPADADQPAAPADAVASPIPGVDTPLSARHEPFDTYWQAPDDVEKGFSSFATYYQANILPHVPADKAAAILVVSCGPGYLVNLLKERGYTAVTGIDSDPAKIEPGLRRGLALRAADAFRFVYDAPAASYDCVVCEQELNHLTYDEMIAFLKMCRAALKPGGTVVVYGLNGANPLVGAENLAHNIDHFNTFAEHTLHQVLHLSGFADSKVFPLKLYVFWKNPLNYVGLAVTSVFELGCKVMFKLYGKNVKVLTKKIAATAVKPS